MTRASAYEGQTLDLTKAEELLTHLPRTEQAQELGRCLAAALDILGTAFDALTVQQRDCFHPKRVWPMSTCPDCGATAII